MVPAILYSKRGLLPKQVIDNMFSMENCCIPQCSYGPAFGLDLQYPSITVKNHGRDWCGKGAG